MEGVNADALAREGGARQRVPPRRALGRRRRRPRARCRAARRGRARRAHARRVRDALAALASTSFDLVQYRLAALPKLAALPGLVLAQPALALTVLPTCACLTWCTRPRRPRSRAASTRARASALASRRAQVQQHRRAHARRCARRAAARARSRARAGRRSGALHRARREALLAQVSSTSAGCTPATSCTRDSRSRSRGCSSAATSARTPCGLPRVFETRSTRCSRARATPPSSRARVDSVAAHARGYQRRRRRRLASDAPAAARRALCTRRRWRRQRRRRHPRERRALPAWRGARRNRRARA